MAENGRSWTKRVVYDLSRVVARLLGVVLFRIRCEGRQSVPPQGGALVCMNHQSYLDPIFVGLACDRPLNYLARESLFQYSAFRWLVQWYDAIPIQREGLGIGGLKETLRRLKREELVLIFPEGTRTPDGTVQPLKPGFCALARRGRVPIVPVGLDGAFDAWPRTRAWPRLARVGIAFGPPITPEQIQQMTDEQLVESLQERIAACYEQARRMRQVHRQAAEIGPA